MSNDQMKTKHRRRHAMIGAPSQKNGTQSQNCGNWRGD